VALTLFTSPRFVDHLMPPGHPERVERAEVMLTVAEGFRRAGGTVLEPPPAPMEALGRVHGAGHLARLSGTAGRAVALDADTFTSPDSWEVARLAAGAAMAAVDRAIDGGRGARALALVRPPGHHAEADRAMGFCLLNNVAVAAAHARVRGVTRVAIVDYDVHHGNGTQWHFYADPAVLFVSSHQYPFYPGTGAASETGTGAGAGATINVPLAAGAADADYELVYERIVYPALRRFEPDLLLVSAGFDAHRDDPLGGMRLTTPQVARLTAGLQAVADECCEGRLVAVTEGGYDLPALAACLQAVIGVLAGSAEVGPAPGGPASRGEAALETVRPYLEAAGRR
jgi:acetoin utilization deacetylase AcuC-like enzyme